MNYKILFVFVFLFLTSCSSSRNIIYLNDLRDNNYSEEVKNRADPVIQPDDVLSISMSSLNPESNLLFNAGVMTTVGSNSTSSVGRSGDGYLVDKNGFINFPVLGKVKLAGLTKGEATDKMTAEINKNVKNPIVNIRFLNFKITVVGEVNRPSSFTVASESLNIIEALGLAGDLTPYGKRENILIIRERNGIRTATRVDITSKEVFKSPSFYLQQNDIVYVEPVKNKALQTSNFSSYAPAVSLVISTLTILLFSFK